ncbi:MAG: PLP-dependent lyase/thiolase [Actinomycetota bacterium]
MTEANPFLRYRDRLDAYGPVREGKLSDQRFVELVEGLDAAVATVEGRPGDPGFAPTPLVDGTTLAAAAGLDAELWIKAEPGNVAGSHKARHLFGVAVHLLVAEAVDGRSETGGQRLAIASCGNAALAAGVIAAALDRPLDVFVPTWADDGIVDRLTDLGADVARCPRRDGEAGDPAYLRFREAVAAGARSFSVQGTDTPATFDGGRTLGWEIADQLPPDDRPGTDALYLQVGGGALATATSEALSGATLYPVQTEGCAPLRRAWDRLAPTFDFAAAEADPDAYMWPWESEPHSLATGILDDVTYDWLPLLRRTRATGGEPIVVPEPVVVEAYRLAHAHTAIPVCATGSSGLAGLLHHQTVAAADHRRVILVFSGIDRT